MNFIKRIYENAKKIKEQEKQLIESQEKKLLEIHEKEVSLYSLAWFIFNNPNVPQEEKRFGKFDDFIIVLKKCEYPSMTWLSADVQRERYFLPKTLEELKFNLVVGGGLTLESVKVLKDAGLYKDFYKDCEVFKLNLNINPCFSNNKSKFDLTLQSLHGGYKVTGKKMPLTEYWYELCNRLYIHEASLNSKNVIRIQDIENITHYINGRFDKIKENSTYKHYYNIASKQKTQVEQQQYNNAIDFVNSLVD